MLLFLTAAEIGPVSGTLLVLYPLFDVAAIVVDSRTSRGGASLALYANIAISTLAAAGLAFAVTSGIPAVLRGVGHLGGGVRGGSAGRWGGAAEPWRAVADDSQRRYFHARRYVVHPAGGVGGATLSNLTGYAAIGGVFFLVSALRLRRALVEG